MDLDALGKSPIGRLIPIPVPSADGAPNGHYFAFVPNPLSQNPHLSEATINAITNAAMAIARLDVTISALPNPQLLVRLMIRREATATSALEGTHAELGEVLHSDFLEENQMSREQKEILNVIRATEFLMEQIKTRPLSRTLLGETQLLIVKGTRDEEWDSGDLRKRQVIIGRQGAPIEESRFIPPPNGPELEEGFSDWEKWINNFRSIPIIVRMALGHYQFETLHPYNNGNGRVGRLVALMQLIEEGILKFPVLDLSSWFDKNKDAYIDNLLRLSETGDIDIWIQFFSKAIEVRSNEITIIANKLIGFRDQTKKKMMETGFRGVTAFHIIDQLIGYPILDIQSAQIFTGKSFESTNAAVVKLVEAGILREISGRKRNRIFMCREVMDIVQE